MSAVLYYMHKVTELKSEHCFEISHHLNICVVSNMKKTMKNKHWNNL